MKRVFDIMLAIMLSVLVLPLFIIIFLIIKVVSPGPSLYFSKRIGINNKLFDMPKFRTMKLDTPQVATHLLKNSNDYLIPLGKVIRKLSLDEIPQLYSIIIGDMSFVGPRPALYNQDDLKEKREKLGIHTIAPGLTGWAQINGRDDISIDDKVILDHYYYKNKSFLFDMKIIVLTLVKVIFAKNISH